MCREEWGVYSASCGPSLAGRVSSGLYFCLFSESETTYNWKEGEGAEAAPSPMQTLVRRSSQQSVIVARLCARLDS